MSDQPKEIESLNNEDLDVEGLTPEELEQVSGGEEQDCATFSCTGFGCTGFGKEI